MHILWARPFIMDLLMKQGIIKGLVIEFRRCVYTIYKVNGDYKKSQI